MQEKEVNIYLFSYNRLQSSWIGKVSLNEKIKDDALWQFLVKPQQVQVAGEIQSGTCSKDKKRFIVVVIF